MLPLIVTFLLVTRSSGQSDPAGSAQHHKCPCILREQCPRVYGISDLDFKELGNLEPCDEDDMVRCCGVTVCNPFMIFERDSTIY